LPPVRQINLGHIITEDEANGIIHCKDGVVIAFLNRIYEILTQRRYDPPHPNTQTHSSL
jgi:hypothetical protein